MTERVKTTAKIENRETKEMSAETMIIFGVNGAEELAQGKTKGIHVSAGFFGYVIPEQVYAIIMSDLIARITLERYRELDHTTQSFLLYEIGNHLLDKSKEVVDGLTYEQKKEDLERHKIELVAAILSNYFENMQPK
jgi:hypothetical protein